MLKPKILRAARALLEWEQSDLAQAAGLSIATIRKIEQGATGVRHYTEDQIIGAFDRAGLLIQNSESGRIVIRLEQLRVNKQMSSGSSGPSTKDLQEHMSNCQHPECVATRKLQAHGARLMLGKARHLEIAALAAAGDQGKSDGDLVQARRDYAEHLGVNLEGPIADAETAVHASWAAKGPNVKDPIHLGSATVIQTSRSPPDRADDHYVLKWPL
jgi:transcriptional regulator with XRE-family HTH domain